MNESGTDRATILKLTAVSALAAAVALLTVVLPAEYDIDPLGTGALLGLSGISGQETSGVVNPSGNPIANDTVRFTLQPWESVEYKYELPAGAGLVYFWQATAPVVFEFHGEPEGGPEGFAETWTRGEGTTGGGTALPPFAGKHGWFWENRSFEAVTVSLSASGQFTRMYTYRDGFVTEATPTTATR